MRVRVVKFSDGDDPVYFINGTRSEDLQHHDDLLRHLVGHHLDAFDTTWLAPMNWDNPEPWEDVSYIQTEDDLDAHLAKFPEVRE